MSTYRKKSKYSNVRSGGFDSKKEHRRYNELLLLQRAGQISELKTQVRYRFEKLKYPSNRIPAYVADFTYQENGKLVVEDCKGYRTPLYKLKATLMEYFYNIKILET